MIIQYIRNKQREKIGVIVALPLKEGEPIYNQITLYDLTGIFSKHDIADSFSIGWSKCNMKLDRFDWRQGRHYPRWGVELAITRALEATPIVKIKMGNEDLTFEPVLPQSCEAVCQKVINRACRAYGNKCKQITYAWSLGYDKLQMSTD